MNLVLTILGLALNTALLVLVTRRLLGVPVGWLRTLVVSALVTAGMGGLLGYAATELGLVDAQDRLASGTSLAVSLGLLVLLVAWGVALGMGVLVFLEALAPTGSLPSPLAVLRDLPARRRRSKRYAEVVRIAVDHGLGGFLRAGARLPDRGDHQRWGRQLRQAFSAAGVTFVKLGQMLGTRPDLIGPGLARELGKLQADTPAEPWPGIERTLRRELGEDWHDHFRSVDETPLAAASVGQVHGAELTDGTAVVIKVQRARAEAQVRADLDILLRMARWVDRTTVWGQALGVRVLAEGFAASLEEELDYRVEAANAAGVAAAARHRARPRRGEAPAVRVPATYPDLSTSRVLVMERIDGVPLSRPGAADGLSEGERAQLAEGLLRSVLTQVLGAGVFHSDLHAGNVLLERAAEGRPRLALLDFGSVGRLDRTAREGMGRLMVAVDRGDSLGAVDAVCDMLDAPDDLDDRALERELGTVISRVQTGGGPSTTLTVFGEVFSLVVRHGFVVHPAIAAALRALGTLEGTLRVLDPEVDLVSVARETGQEQLGLQLGPQQVRAALEEQLVHVLPLLQRLPRRVDSIAATVQSGQAQMRVRWLAHPDDRAFLTGMLHHIVITWLASVLAVCGVALVVAGGGWRLTPDLTLYPVLGSTLFLFAFVLAARSLALVFRRPR